MAKGEATWTNYPGRNRKPGGCDKCGVYLKPGEGSLWRCGEEDVRCHVPAHSDGGGWHLECLDRPGCEERRKARREETARKRAAQEAAEREAVVQLEQMQVRRQVLRDELTVSGYIKAEYPPMLPIPGGWQETIPGGWQLVEELSEPRGKYGRPSAWYTASIDGVEVHKESIAILDEHRDYYYAPVAMTQEWQSIWYYIKLRDPDDAEMSAWMKRQRVAIVDAIRRAVRIG